MEEQTAPPFLCPDNQHGVRAVLSLGRPEFHLHSSCHIADKGLQPGYGIQPVGTQLFPLVMFQGTDLLSCRYRYRQKENLLRQIR